MTSAFGMSKRGIGLAMNRLKRWLAAFLGIASVFHAGSTTSAPRHPQGWSDRSFYLPMRDGTRLAVGLWYPGDRLPRTRVPVVLIQTRYGRAGTFIHGENGFYPDLLKKGYAVAIVDTRGSTASFGPRNVELGPDEIADMDVLIR